MGLTPVPDDQLATIVTSLVMTGRPPLRPAAPSPLRLVHWLAPEPDKYRALFRRVGGPWLWYSRLAMDDARLTAIIRAPAVSVFAVTDRAGIEVGMVELDQLSYFGLIPELAGKGHGRWLMGEAMTRAWRADVKQVTVNTCTLDHPSALNFYRAQGFVAVKRTIETFPDPRVLGLLPADAAPHIPLLASLR